MSGNRLPDYLDHIQQAATDACGFIDGLSKEDFLADKRTQSAVVVEAGSRFKLQDSSLARCPWRGR